MVNNRTFVYILAMLFICVFSQPITADTLTIIAEFEQYSANTNMSDLTTKIEIWYSDILDYNDYEAMIGSDNSAHFSVILNKNTIGPLYLSIESNTMLTPGGKKLSEIPYWFSYVKGLRPAILYLSADGRIYEDSTPVKKIRIGNLVQQPIFNPVPGVDDEGKITEIFIINKEVVITTATAGAAIKYTTDGSDPETNGVEIANGETVNLITTTTLKAVGVKDGWINSYAASQVYLFKVADPVIVCDENNTVLMTSATEKAVIWYTVDGKKPMPGKSMQYRNPFVIEKNTTIKAVATRGKDEPSEVVVVTFTIE